MKYYLLFIEIIQIIHGGGHAKVRAGLAEVETVEASKDQCVSVDETIEIYHFVWDSENERWIFDRNYSREKDSKVATIKI